MPIGSRLRRRLEEIVGEARLLAEPERLEPYSHDETPGLQPRLPDAVALPRSAQEVSKLLQTCGAAGVPVTPRGGGTGHSGGCVAVEGGVVLAMTRFDRVAQVSTADLTVDVEPGVILEALHDAVEAEGLFYPPDPGSLDSCTVGGTVAENAGGPRALRYGVTRDYVLGLEVVLPSGQVTRIGRRTVKGVSGYDLTSLFVGSEGTLGVITGVTLKLLPRPRHVATALVTFDAADTAAAAITAMLTAGLLPRTLEYMDGRCIDALRGSAPFRFPGEIDAALIVETDGDEAEATLASLARAVDLLDRHGARSTLVAQDARQQRDLWASRRQLSEATRHIAGRKVAEDIAVPRGRIPEALARIGVIGERYGLLTAAYGHAGDGNLHVQVLFSEEGERPTVERALTDIMAMAIELGGTLTGEHGIGVAKRRFMGLEHSEAALTMMRQLKRSLDPGGILNPGKIL